MKHVKKGFFTAACLLAMAVVSAGCSSKASAVDENMLGVWQPVTDQVTITITCNAKLDHFAAAAAKRFPDINLVQDCYTEQYRISEHIADIEHHDFGDILMVKGGHIPKVNMADQLIDLSTQPFPVNFNANLLQADENGHITLIPGPLSFNCNVYNKTLFEENNWQVPESYEEFISLIQKINQTGIRAFRNSYFDSASQSYQIYQYSVFSALDTLTQVDGQIWHNKLMSGEAVSLDPMKTAFEDMQRMMDIGAIKPEDMQVPFNENIEALASRKVAIGGGEIDHIKILNDSSKDTFRFMPHFSMTDGQGWLLNLGYFFGVNKDLRQPENEKKLSAAMEIMNFIASEEGQNALVEDGLGMMPATLDAKIPDDPVLAQIHTQIESGRYIMRPTYDMFSSVLKTDIGAFLRGERSSEEILDRCSLVLKQGPPPVQSLSEASDNFTILQTGCLKADALRAAADTDVSLIGISEVNGYDPVGATRTKLYKGPLTEDDITRIAQPLMDLPLMTVRASVTGKELLSLLEYGATSEAEQSDGKVSHFHPFAVSGLTLTYHLNRDQGERVTSVTMEDGSKLEPDTKYTISYITGAFPKGQFDETETGITLTDALRKYITKEKKIAADKLRIQLNY